MRRPIGPRCIRALALAAMVSALFAPDPCGTAAFPFVEQGGGPSGETEGAPPPAPARPNGGEFVRGRVITPSGRRFDIEVAQDGPSRARGLQGRASVPRETGMLFVFPEPAVHKFWMYQCRIPLDMLWLDASGRVLHVAANAFPCPTLPCADYGPEVPSVYVLELAGGAAKAAGISPGQRLTILFSGPRNPT